MHLSTDKVQLRLPREVHLGLEDPMVILVTKEILVPKVILDHQGLLVILVILDKGEILVIQVPKGNLVPQGEQVVSLLV